jgi:hypothetical protein
LQDAFILHEASGVEDFREVIGIGVDSDVLAAAQVGQGSHWRYVDDLHFFAKPFAEGNLGVVRSA